MARTNEHDQPIGEPLGNWTPPPRPAHAELTGRHTLLKPLQRTHAIPLFHTFRAADDAMWTYMPLGPFGDAAEIGQLIDSMNKAPDLSPYAVIIDDEVQGFLTHMRTQADIGTIEIGWVAFATAMQRTTASTEAIYLLLAHAFDTGFRRVEWKCDALNQQSRTTAERLGFTYEGTFRKATHYKGRNRDTAWYAMTDDDWQQNGPRLREWLDPSNFDERGLQRRRLGDIA